MFKPIMLLLSSTLIFMSSAIPTYGHPLNPPPQGGKTITRFSSDDKNPMDIAPNESGQIMILMYHGVEAGRPSAPYQRTVEGFKSDLEKLYENNFQLISLSDLAHNNIKTVAGKTPVVITFDDAYSSAFSFVLEEGELVPLKDCAVDIMNNFSKEHPDFGCTATFFVSGKGRHPFLGKGTLAERFKYLVSNGYELGNHTYTHPHMSRLDEKQIQAELGEVEKIIKENTNSYNMCTLAYPYGDRPKKDLQHFALNGTYEDKDYQYLLAIREGQSGASSNPVNINFDPLNIPRVRGTNNAKYDLGWFLKHYNKHPENKYISDGDPDTISVPSDMIQNVNVSAIGEKELIIYEKEIDS